MVPNLKKKKKRNKLVVARGGKVSKSAMYKRANKGYGGAW